MSDQPQFVPPTAAPAPVASPSPAETPDQQEPQPVQQPVTPQPAHTSNGMAITSMVLGIISLLTFGPGILLGIPAIVLGIIALKKKQGEKGFSITGIVTGGISTAISLVFIVLILIFAAALGGYSSYSSSSSEPSYQQEL